MALALLANTKPPLIQLLNANRGAYSTSVGTTGATKIGAYPFDQEITDALLHADGLVVTEGYFQSKKEALRNRFYVDSGNIADGALIPEFDGIMGKKEWSTDSVTWKPSIEAKSKDDITGANQQGSYVGSGAFAGMHWFEDGFVFHTSTYFRFQKPTYTKTSVLQANEAHEPLIIAWAMELLYKAHSLAPHEYYQKMRMELLERVLAGSMRMRTLMPGPLPPEMRG